MATVKISYATSATVTCTLAALASSSNLARSSTSIDNGTNLYDDVLLYLAVKTSGTAVGADKACYVYVFGSEDGTNFTGSSIEAEGTDILTTIEAGTNLRGPIPIACQGTSATYKGVVSVAQFFGGRMPRKWGFVLRNSTAQNLDSTETNHTKTYTGITYTVV